MPSSKGLKTKKIFKIIDLYYFRKRPAHTISNRLHKFDVLLSEPHFPYIDTKPRRARIIYALFTRDTLAWYRCLVNFKTFTINIIPSRTYEWHLQSSAAPKNRQLIRETTCKFRSRNDFDISLPSTCTVQISGRCSLHRNNGTQPAHGILSTGNGSSTCNLGVVW